MGSRKKLNNGEGLTSQDLNDLQDYIRKSVTDELMLMMTGTDQMGDTLHNLDNDDIMRPIGYSGAMRRASASTVGVNGGTWLYRPQGAVSPDGAIAKIAHKVGVTTLTVTGFAGLGATLRRDIIQARIVEADEAAVLRNFKDAVTGALSSQSLVKRTNWTVEYALKQGVPAGSATAALEPAADAGWTKIGSVLVRAAGVTDNTETYDWRIPFGDSTYVSLPMEMQTQSGAGEWIISSDAEGWHRKSTVVAGFQLNAFCNPSAPSYQDYNALQTSYGSQRRIMRVTLRANFGAQPAAGDVALLRHGYSVQFAGNAALFAIAAGMGAARVSAVSADHFIFGRAAYPNDPPLWMNGQHSAMGSVGGEFRRVSLTMDSPTTNDKIFGVQWCLAG